MKYSLGISATQTDNYLSVNLEFGDEETLTPQYVKQAQITIKNKEGLELRTLSTLSEFSNSDGCFKLGTILFEEEVPYEIHAMVKTSKGTFKKSCIVMVMQNTITSEQF